MYVCIYAFLHHSDLSPNLSSIRFWQVSTGLFLHLSCNDSIDKWFRIGSQDHIWVKPVIVCLVCLRPGLQQGCLFNCYSVRLIECIGSITVWVHTLILVQYRHSWFVQAVNHQNYAKHYCKPNFSGTSVVMTHKSNALPKSVLFPFGWSCGCGPRWTWVAQRNACKANTEQALLSCEQGCS